MKTTTSIKDNASQKTSKPVTAHHFSARGKAPMAFTEYAKEAILDLGDSEHGHQSRVPLTHLGGPRFGNKKQGIYACLIPSRSTGLGTGIVDRKEALEVTFRNGEKRILNKDGTTLLEPEEAAAATKEVHALFAQK